MKRVIFNADDFGLTEGINSGILECHVRGPVTSTSLLVRAPATSDAVDRAQGHPKLAVGLHFDDQAGELEQQLQEFELLVGRPPTHIDSHHHAHENHERLPLFEAAAARLGVPLRGHGAIAYVGGFYAQWEWQVTDLEHVSVEFLQQLLAEEVTEGWTEIACHPGYATADLRDDYTTEREAELRTLTDPRVMEAIERLGIELASFADYAVSP